MESLVVADSTATSLTLRWQPSSTAAADRVVIRRVLGTQAPQSPTDGTLVAELASTVTGYVDTGLSSSTMYSYSLFAAVSTAGPIYSAPLSRSVWTPANSRPDIPIITSMNPAPGDFAEHGCSVTSWLGATLSSDMSIATYLSDPDGVQDSVYATMTFVDLGVGGADTPTQLIPNQDDNGTSSTVAGSGGQVLSHIPTSDLVEGHQYELTFVAHDGSAQSAPVTCHFGYDPSAPTQPEITSTDFPTSTGTPVGTTGEFHISASDTIPQNGGYGGIDHFVYAFGDPTLLDGGGGARLAATIDGADATAQLTFTPTAWGETYLFVAAIDKAGNESAIGTYSFYVYDA